MVVGGLKKSIEGNAQSLFIPKEFSVYCFIDYYNIDDMSSISKQNDQNGV